KQTHREQPRQHVFCSAHGSLLFLLDRDFSIRRKALGAAQPQRKIDRAPFASPPSRGREEKGQIVSVNGVSLNDCIVGNFCKRPKFRHGLLPSRLTWISLEASLRIWVPAVHAGMTKLSIFMLYRRA